MPEFPSSPVSPAELLETYLPAAFAEAGVPGGAREVDVRLGVLLEGEGGGEWVLAIQGGEVSVRPGSRVDTAFSYVQTVDDWTGALWEGRGGAVGQAVAGLFRPGQRQAREGAGSGMGASPNPAALEAMRSLQGLVRMVVAGADGEGDWRVDLKLGPGEIPPDPTTTVTVSAEDALKMARGELDAMQAFMAGRIRVEGDMTLMFQMQAAQMQAMGKMAGRS